MSALCRRVGCRLREERTGRDRAFLSEMNYRRIFDSWCRLYGKYRLCQVNFEKASIFGQRQSAWPFWEQPQFSLLRLLLCSFFLISFFSQFHSFLPSSFLFVGARRARPWQQRSLIEAAIVYQRNPLMKRPSPFCWNICTNLLATTSIRRVPLLQNKHASSVDRQFYSPACVLH